MEKVFQTSDVVVRADAGTLTIRHRIAYTMAVTAGSVLFGGLLFLLSGAEPPWSPRTAEASFPLLAWVSYGFFGIGLFGVGAVAVRALKRPIVLDRAAGVLRYRARPIPFADIDRIEVAVTQVQGLRAAGIQLVTGAHTLLLLPLSLASHEQQLQRLCQVMNHMVAAEGSGKPAPGGEADAAKWERRLTRQIVAAGGLVLGSVWSIAGFLVVPDYVFTRRGSEHGFLVWPLGIWIAALGALELAGVPAYRWLKEGPKKPAGALRRRLDGVLRPRGLRVTPFGVHRKLFTAAGSSRADCGRSS